jgi:glycogen(starch) synthase
MPDVDVQLPPYIPHVPGVLVLDRGRQGFDAATQQLTDHVYGFSRLTRRQRIEMRNRVERLASRFGWDTLAPHYHQAHELALSYLAGAESRRGRLEIVQV